MSYMISLEIHPLLEIFPAPESWVSFHGASPPLQAELCHSNSLPYFTEWPIFSTLPFRSALHSCSMSSAILIQDPFFIHMFICRAVYSI